MTITLTDHEQAFADSAQGKAAVARERMKHDMGEGWKGGNARPWTDALEASTVRSLSMQAARNAVQVLAFTADQERQAPALRAAAERARAGMIDHLCNAWRNNN